MKFKNIINKLNFGTAIILILILAVLINLVSLQVFARWDLTQNKNYSLSIASKDLARNLDDYVIVRVYFSENLPAQYLSVKQDVSDLLKEYEAYSGKFIVEYVNPDQNDIAEKAGIPKLQFNDYQKDKLQVTSGYLGLTLSYKTKTEVIPVVQSTSNLEYQLSSLVKKMQTKELIEVGYVSSHGAIDFNSQEVKNAAQALQEMYELKPVNLKDTAEIAKNIKILIIAGAKEKFNEVELKKIDKFLTSGNSVMVLQDMVELGEGLSAKASESNINDLLDKYGIKINKDLVSDRSSGLAAFNQGFMTFQIEYSLWPKLINKNFDQASPLVSRLDSVVLPWASSLEMDKTKFGEAKLVELAKTTENSWSQNENYNLDPTNNKSANKLSQQVMIASLTGKIKSAYNQGEASQSRLVVLGDSDFIKDGIVQQNQANLVMFRNLVDGLALDESLINIRAKNIIDRPLTDLTDQKKQSLRYFNVLGFPILLLGLGTWRYYWRRRK